MLALVVASVLSISDAIIYNLSPTAQIKHVYSEITSHNRVPVLPLELRKDHDDICQNTLTANAYTDGTKIVVCAGLLNPRSDAPVDNEDQLAFVLAHEEGHLSPDVYHLPAMKVELGADKKAMEYLRHTHYDACKGAKWLLKTGDGGYSYDEKGNKTGYHPGGKERYKALGCN